MNTVKLLVCTLCLFFSSMTIAETIHWELSSTPQGDVGLTGGFDYNSEAGGGISNVTLRTYTGDVLPPGCFLCIDATGYEGTVLETGVSFYREFFRDGNHAGYFLFSIFSPGFSVTDPGTFSDLNLQAQRHSASPDPFDDIFDDIFCAGCVVAVGKIITTPIPEPETYGMLIAGLGILGWWGRHKKTDHPLRQAT